MRKLATHRGCEVALGFPDPPAYSVIQTSQTSLPGREEVKIKIPVNSYRDNPGVTVFGFVPLRDPMSCLTAWQQNTHLSAFLTCFCFAEV